MKNIPINIVKTIKKANNILICSHINPDGDAIGSCLAMAHGLKFLDKNCMIFNESSFPEYLKFLNIPVSFHTKMEEFEFEPELIIVLDCGDQYRLGENTEKYIQNKQVINIDHHIGNTMFGMQNWVDSSMAATGLMVADLLKKLDVEFTKDLATALYIALCTDTGNFTYDNTDTYCLKWLTKLAKTNIEIPKIQHKLNSNFSINKLHFWARLLMEIKVCESGQLAYCKIPLEYYDKYGTTSDDLHGFIEQMRCLKDVRVIMLVREINREINKEKVKISLRSYGDDNVRDVLSSLGGGGHKNAAGLTIDLGLDDAVEKIIPYIRKIW